MEDPEDASQVAFLAGQCLLQFIKKWFSDAEALTLLQVLVRTGRKVI